MVNGLKVTLYAVLFAAFCSTGSCPARADTSAGKGVPVPTEGWENGGKYPPLGSPKAKRDVKDALPIVISSFPPTLRGDGPNSNTSTTSTFHGLMYESLIGIHPTTEEFIPQLASEWNIVTDKAAGSQTFWFRVNPRARWSDGSPVTARDVYYSWWHRVQEDRNDPSNVLVFKEEYEEPVVVDERTIRVTTRRMRWRNFLYFGGMPIYPEKEIHIPGKKYLDQYNWKMMTGSGPYDLKPEDLKKGRQVTLTRRWDWWADSEPWARNTANFHALKFVVVREPELQYQKFMAGEHDFYEVSRAQRWVEDIPKEDKIEKGWVQRRKIYTQSPEGFGGLVMNMRIPPFNDRRVRLAFCHLFNREALFEKLFFNEYAFTDSYFPGRDWGNGGNNPEIRFDPDKAEELLWEAGYKERDDDGYLVGPDGKRFEVTLEYGAQSRERIWLVIKPDFEDAGIKFNLKLIDYSTLIKRVYERQFKVTWWSWSALLFPNPETSWKSSLADKPQNNNLPGFKNARVDALCAKYDITFDRAEQKKIVREIDAIVFEEHPYALGWFANFNRILYWDKFGHPERYFTRIGQLPPSEILGYWWFDADKIENLKAAMDAGRPIPRGPVVIKPWEDFGK